MRITNEELFEIITEASYKLHREIRKAYKNNTLENYLRSIGMEELIPVEEEPLFDTFEDGNIIIFGDSQIKAKEIYGCFKEFGITKDRIELHLEYKEIKNYAFNKLQYNPNYRLILFGPVPHSVQGKDDFSSIIAKLEQTDGYPKVIRLTDGHNLKITKTSLKEAIRSQIDSGYLVA